MKPRSHKQKIGLVLLTLVAVNAAFLWWLFRDPSPGAKPGARPEPDLNLPELQEIASKKSYQELSAYLENVAEEKGAEYAFAVLRAAPLPPDTDLHLLGHVVGDKLYDQEGAKGMRLCTQEFRNACSHSIVVGLFTDQGDAALPEIADACRKAPGGTGAYAMCFHGLGHGILSYVGYDMPQATGLCKKTGTEEFRNREYIECVGGTVMEIIGGGFHDRELWAKKSTEYLRGKDPLSLCLSDFIPQAAKGQCFVYLTPNLFIAGGGNLQRPLPEHFAKAFTFCDPLVGEYRAACYGGFGKEFVVLAPDRDIRRLEKMSDAELGKIIEWCGLAGKSPDVQVCLNSAMNSLYWGGENDPAISLRFCGLQKPEAQHGCYQGLTNAVFFYVKDPAYQRSFCNSLPSAHRTDCEARMKRS